MTWVRFDDATAEHPKFSSLGDYAPLCGWLWFSASCYCMRHLTDGRIDLPTLRRLWPFRHVSVATGGIGDGNGGMLAEFGDDPTVEDLIMRCVTARLFDQISPGFYRVHDLMDYNPSKREVLEARKKKEKAGQAGGLASAQARGQAHASRLLQESLNPPSPSPTPKTKPPTPFAQNRTADPAPARTRHPYDTTPPDADPTNPEHFRFNIPD